MWGFLLRSLIYIIPISAIVLFIVSLCDYFDAKKKYAAEPNDSNEQRKKTAKKVFIVSSVIMGVLLAVVLGFMALMFMAVAYM